MPFIKKISKPTLQPPTDTEPLFIGRTGELLFFKQNVLKNEDPTHNIISISGQGGVGKSTLLTRLIAEAHAPSFKDYCLTALVDERQTTPIEIMQRFADQLHITGEFMKALTNFKETLRKLRTHRESTHGLLSQKLPDLTGATVEGVPIIGPILREGVKVTTEHLLSEYYNVRVRRDAERLEDPIGDLTKVFISELNRLADGKASQSFYQTKLERRIILFFDTFEQLATEMVPWLLNYFLEAEISSNVVLVVAGRNPIEHSTPHDIKRWLRYYESGIIYSISLNCFTEDETRTYLARQGITDPNRIDTIWQLSQGLPLYLGLLTSNPQGKVDPTQGVVDNFLRWIPEQEQVKRRLVLDVALLSRSFNQDDLEAFTYVPESEYPSFYRWLIEQPFVRSSPQDGRYTYHELAQELFSRHLYQRSQKEYYTTRRVLADYYERLLDEIQVEGSEKVYYSSYWLELSLAQAYQGFFLPDEASQSKAIEQTLYIYKHTRKEQEEEIVRVLRKLTQKRFTKQISSSARRTGEQILHFIETNRDSLESIAIETNRDSLESIAAASSLLEELINRPSFPANLLAFVYRKRGNAYRALKMYQRAIADSNRALELDSNDASNYILRGSSYYWIKEYQQALSDFNRALELDPNSAASYNWRGWTYHHLKEYQQALSDFNRALELDPNDASAYQGRGWTNYYFKKYQQASNDFDRLVELQAVWGYLSRGNFYLGRGSFHRALEQYQRVIADSNRALELDPSDASNYLLRGSSYYWSKEYQQALSDFNRALELDPNSAASYNWRGWTYHRLKEYQQALSDFNRALELDPNDASPYEGRGWTYYYLKEYQGALSDFDRLVELQAVWGYLSRGDLHRKLKQYQQAIADYDQALERDPNDASAYFQRGYTYLWLKNIKQVKSDFARSWELDSSRIRSRWLVIWIEMCQDRPNAGTVERLETIATSDLQHHGEYVCRGTAQYLNRQFEEALAELDQAIQLEPEKMDAYFWKGMTYVSLARDKDAMTVIEKALELDMPPILLTPLRWFEQDRPEFYEKYVRPLLEINE